MTTVARRLAIVFLALTTAACALTNTGDPSVAAVVGDARITTSEIDRYFKAISDAGTQQDVSSQERVNLQTSLVNVRVRSEFLERVAERAGVQVTEADVNALLDEQYGGRERFEEQLTQAGVPDVVKELSFQDVKAQAIVRALQEELGARELSTVVRDQSSAPGVEINPRYGVWNRSSLQVQPFDPLAAQTAPRSSAP